MQPARAASRSVTRRCAAAQGPRDVRPARPGPLWTPLASEMTWACAAQGGTARLEEWTRRSAQDRHICRAVLMPRGSESVQRRQKIVQRGPYPLSHARSPLGARSAPCQPEHRDFTPGGLRRLKTRMRIHVLECIWRNGVLHAYMLVTALSCSCGMSSQFDYLAQDTVSVVGRAALHSAQVRAAHRMEILAWDMLRAHIRMRSLAQRSTP
jgi:hypothetical protein